MRSWQLQTAKARFSELIKAVETEGPQVVSRRGIDVAVVVPLDQWRALQQRSKPDLRDFLLGPGPRFELELPPRGRWKRRPPPTFED